MKRFFQKLLRTSDLRPLISVLLALCVGAKAEILKTEKLKLRAIAFSLLAFQLFSLSAFSSDVRLLWDASPSAGAYNFYASTNTLNRTNLAAASVIVNVGTNQTVHLQDLLPGTWQFAVTAVTTNGFESDPSNIFIGQVPPPPTQMRTILIQANATLTGTNWFNAGFFKIGIQ